MSVLFVLVPMALLLAAGAVVAFVWAAKSGQLDDLETPAVRVLLDDVAQPGAGAAHRRHEKGSGSDPHGGSPEAPRSHR